MIKMLTITAIALYYFLHPTPAHAEQQVCYSMYEDDFIASAEGAGTELFDANARGFSGYLKLTNEQRVKRHLWLLEGDKMVIARYKWKIKEGYAIGVVMFKDGCMVPGSAYQLDEFEFLLKLEPIGLSMDDFISRG